jgi:hypothetical protein
MIVPCRNSSVAGRTTDLWVARRQCCNNRHSYRARQGGLSKHPAFLTYHLTDNIAELALFVVWALSGGRFPLALGILQVLALDIGIDILPALALGMEAPPPSRIVTIPWFFRRNALWKPAHRPSSTAPFHPRAAAARKSCIA